MLMREVLQNETSRIITTDFDHEKSSFEYLKLNVVKINVEMGFGGNKT